MRIAFFSFIIQLLLFTACTREPPEIYQIFWQLNIRKDVEHSSTYEQLSIFVSAGDPDGIDDLEKIYLLNDKEELYWEINSGAWHKADVHGETWIGTNSFIMYDRSPFPEGEYRVMLQDVSGECVERLFSLNVPNIKRKIQFPEPVIKDSILRIKGESPFYSLWVYDKKKTFITPPFEIRDKGIEIKKITSRKRELNEGFEYYIYVYDNTIKRGIITGPFYYSTAN
jgi:hypothetical protein